MLCFLAEILLANVPIVVVHCNLMFLDHKVQFSFFLTELLQIYEIENNISSI